MQNQLNQGHLVKEEAVDVGKESKGTANISVIVSFLILKLFWKNYEK